MSRERPDDRPVHHRAVADRLVLAPAAFLIPIGPGVSEQFAEGRRIAGLARRAAERLQLGERQAREALGFDSAVLVDA